MQLLKIFDDFFKKETKLLEYSEPKDLEKKFNLDRTDNISEELQQIIKYSVKTHNPYFFNQLYAGTDSYGVLGETVGALLNTSMYTYEVAPVFTILEKHLFKRLLEIFGFVDGDAIFAPGGSMSNLYALNLARHRLDNDWSPISDIEEGDIYTSEHSHYSILKFANLMKEHVTKIKCDRQGRMLVDQLEKEILKAKPFVVVATAGTTVFGAFDPIDQIADICQKYKIWLHIDASWGGAAIFSDKKYLFKGIEKADSITFNPHKMLRCPLQASILLVKEKGLLKKCNQMEAKYLFQKDKFYDLSYDTGDMYLQCGRKNDILKLWLQWKTTGELGYKKLIDDNLIKAQYLRNKLKDHSHFKLVIDQFEYTNVCFWYLPTRMILKEYTSDDLHKIAPKIKEKMMKDGSMMIGYQPLGKKPNFFRMILINPDVTFDILDKVIDKIHEYGKDL